MDKVSNEDNSPGRVRIPPPQKNLQRATELGFEALVHQEDEQIAWLGAENMATGSAAAIWRIPVLGDAFEVDLAASRVTTSAGRPVGPFWSILALHYLAVASRPERQTPETVFADLATARSYAGVYHGRVIARLCGTAGRNAEKLTAAASALAARAVDADGDAAYDFDPFPRLSLRLIWHAPDDEFPPSATLLLPANIESFFCAEDIVVLSESLVARLGGKPF